MLSSRTLSAETILATLHAVYGRQAACATFLPGGADVNSAVYRIEPDGHEERAAYLLKVRRADFEPISVELPNFLHTHGIHEVMAPLPTVEGRLWANAHGFIWLLYPFFEGADGYKATLTDAQWVALGRALRAVHNAVLPPTLAIRTPRERYSPRWRNIVRDLDAQVDTRDYSNPLAYSLALFWAAQRVEIRLIVERAEQLGHILRERADVFALCHSDLHPGNVLLGANGEITIVDWDNPIFAPKERDLMLLSGGVSPLWNDPRQDQLFFAGYGAADIDPVALSYYHYERIVADLATFGAQIFDMAGRVEEREWGLKMMQGNFVPGEVVEIAHRRFQQVPSSALV